VLSPERVEKESLEKVCNKFMSTHLYNLASDWHHLSVVAQIFSTHARAIDDHIVLAVQFE
jgi:hypothetical protein